MRNPVRWAIHRIHEKNPLLLSHHPTCQYYSHHTFTLYGAKLCMGCFIVYPIGAASLLVMSLTWLLGPDIWITTQPTSQYYIIGGGFAGPVIAGKVLPDTRTKRYRILSKALLAVGLGIAAFPIIARPTARLQTVAIFTAFLVPYITHKGVTARDDCQGCPEIDDFPDCSGLDFNPGEVQDGEADEQK